MCGVNDLLEIDKEVVSVAHQKKIRDLKAAERTDLFGNWWSDIDVDIKKATVQEISLAQAKEVIEEYEWLGCLAAVNWYAFGIFFDGIIGGVVVYGPEYIENLGKWDKYDYTNRIILLNRGACVHWAHPHAASKLIRGSMKMLPDKFKVVTATVDDLAGEVGTIYQACGFDYVGSMRDSNPNVNSRKGDRDGWIIKGKLYGSRSIRMMLGTTKMDVIKRHYPNVKKVKQNSKGRYFAFRGTKREKKYYRSMMADKFLPYLKRK